MTFFKLLYLNLVVKKRNFVEFTKVFFLYYRKFSFAKVDLALLSLYFFQNPFKISKRFLLEQDEKELDVYGETPLTTLSFITKKVGIQKKDVVFELGSGRGRGCFWLNAFIGCKVVGIEFVPTFIKKANRIKNFFSLKDIEFRNENMLESNFEEGTVFYLYGTCYEDVFINKLIAKFKKLPKGIKIITVSYPLTDYSKHEFELLFHFPAEFTWGTAEVYCQILK